MTLEQTEVGEGPQNREGRGSLARSDVVASGYKSGLLNHVDANLSYHAYIGVTPLRAQSVHDYEAGFGHALPVCLPFLVPPLPYFRFIGDKNKLRNTLPQKSS